MPEELREQVRKQQPEVQPSYSNDAPRSSVATIHLADLVGMDVEVLFDRCGEPDAVKLDGRRLAYRSCRNSDGFEVSVRAGKVTRIWY